MPPRPAKSPQPILHLIWSVLEISPNLNMRNQITHMLDRWCIELALTNRYKRGPLSIAQLNKVLFQTNHHLSFKLTHPPLKTHKGTTQQTSRKWELFHHAMGLKQWPLFHWVPQRFHQPRLRRPEIPMVESLLRRLISWTEMGSSSRRHQSSMNLYLVMYLRPWLSKIHAEPKWKNTTRGGWPHQAGKSLNVSWDAMTPWGRKLDQSREGSGVQWDEVSWPTVRVSKISSTTWNSFIDKTGSWRHGSGNWIEGQKTWFLDI